MTIASGSAQRRQQIDANMAEAARQGRITQGTAAIDNTFGQFNDDFYRQQRQGFLDFANPQLSDQYANARRELTFALDRSGMLNSSARAQRERELEQLYGTNQRAINDQALSYETDARNRVEQARSGLLASLNASGNAEAAGNAAAQQAQALSTPAAYSPIGQLFADFTSGLGRQMQYDRLANMWGADYGGRYNTGLFGPPRGAVVTT